MGDKGEILKNILVREGGDWRKFLFPIHKKILPVVIPAGALGFVFYNIMIFFVGNGFTESFKGKIFLTAAIFLYVWVVILFFVLSSLVFTIAEVYQRSPPVMERLRKIEEKGR